MNRRGFLQAILLAGVAPAFIPRGALGILAPSTRLVLPGSWLAGVREIMAYDLVRDVYMARWDVIGADGTQLHVDAEIWPDCERAEGLAAIGGKIACFSKAGPTIDAVREPALFVLKNEIEHRGLLVTRDKLKRPEGVEHARFLA